MEKPTLARVLGRSVCAVLVGVSISHCGRFGYEDVQLLEDETRAGRSQDEAPIDERSDRDASDGLPRDADASIQDGDVTGNPGDAGQPGANAEAGMGSKPDAAAPNSLDDGLVAYWSIEEGAGSLLNDSSPNDNQARLMGSVTWSDSARGSVLALSDQQSNYARVEPSHSIDAIRNGVSIGAWVFTVGSGWEQAILSRQRGQTSDQHYSLQIFQRQIQLQIGASKLSYAPTSFPLAVWFHLAATYDGVTAKLYIDGVEVLALAVPKALAADNTPVLLGSKQDKQTITSALNGNLDSIRLYDRALSAAEVAALAQ